MLDGGDNVAAGWTPVSLSSRGETLAPGQSGEFRLTIPRVGGEGFRLLEFERERPIAVLLQLTTTDAETQAGTRIADPSYLAFQRSPSESRFWLPDLIATGIRWEPEVPTVGRDVKVIVTVQNQHKTVGAGESALVLQVDGKDVGETTLDAMGPGQSIGVEFTWKALDGASIFGAVVDSRSQVEERLETNNRTTANFGGALVPDLVLESPTWSPISPLVGDTLTFTLVVGNQGDLVSGDFRVYVFLDDGISPTWDLAIAGIGKQQRVTTTYAWTAVAGTHTFRVVVDGFNDLGESDKTNNSATASPTVKSSGRPGDREPDLEPKFSVARTIGEPIPDVEEPGCGFIWRFQGTRLPGPRVQPDQDYPFLLDYRGEERHRFLLLDRAARAPRLSGSRGWWGGGLGDR